MHSATELISDALSLKPAERYVIIEALVHSLDAPDATIDAAWIDEAEKRLEAYKAGKLNSVTFEEMFGQ